MNLIKITHAQGFGTGSFYVNRDAVVSIVPQSFGSSTVTEVTLMCGTKYFLSLSLEAVHGLATGQINSFEEAQKFDSDNVAKAQ